MILPARRVPWVPLITLILGCALLAASFATSATPALFVPFSLAVAVVWTAGGLWSRRVARRRFAGTAEELASQRPGHNQLPGQSSRPGQSQRLSGKRSLGLAVAVAVATAALFLAGTWILSMLPLTSDFLAAATTAASVTPLWLTVVVATLNGWGEEIFFRGAVPSFLGRHGRWWAIGVYTVSTLFTGNVVLVLAAPLLGAICQLVLGRTGRLWTACVVHTGFSLGVVGLVPLLFR